MKPAARIQAAIDVLTEVLTRHRTAASALSDWGRAHRFAGSGDRAAIGNLVYDCLRRKASAAHLMEADTPRAVALGTLRLAWGESVEAIAALADGSMHAPTALTGGERAALGRGLPADTPSHVLGDFPAWLAAALDRAFGASLLVEMQALRMRAPLDLRTNTLRATREQVLAVLAPQGAAPTRMSPHGVRIAATGHSGRMPNVEVLDAHARGWYEVQDEGSQIAALLTGAQPGMAVLDLCAGAGGKTLAMAALMENRGSLHVYDSDPARLRPIHDRLKRAGATNITVLDAGQAGHLTSLAGRMDSALVDAPCTGSGVWRRHPETKWRLNAAELDQRRAQQIKVLDAAAPLVRPGGRLVYVTCSVLPEENGDQVAAFLERHADFSVVPTENAWAATIAGTAPASADGRNDTLQLTPHTHGTDGFFVAVLERSA
jgi:16S rRNA (cytosine967-C5)-methyltransferase